MKRVAPNNATNAYSFLEAENKNAAFVRAWLNILPELFVAPTFVPKHSTLHVFGKRVEKDGAFSKNQIHYYKSQADYYRAVQRVF